MTKSINHWYPRYPADYGKKTRHLSMMEHGAYALLMDYCYSTGNPIPANAVQVHRICMAFASDEQDACMRVLHEFFTEQPDGWHNDRIDEELEKRNDISDKRSKAAQKRYEKKPANAHAIAPANADTATATANIDKIDEDTSVSSMPNKRGRGSRLAEDWFLPMEWGNVALEKGLTTEEIRVQAEKFKNHWISKTGKDATKANWKATWGNWVLSYIERRPQHVQRNYNSQQSSQGQRGSDPGLANIARLLNLDQA